MLVVFLCGLVALILMRTLKNDCARYRTEDGDLELVRLSRNVSCSYSVVFRSVLTDTRVAGHVFFVLEMRHAGGPGRSCV